MAANAQPDAAEAAAEAPEGTLSLQLDELRREAARAPLADALLRRVELVAAIGAAYEEQLRAVRRNLRQLEDLYLPVCMFCKRVRTDDSYWERIERFFARRADVTFSHGVCPSCFEERFGALGTPPPPAPPAGGAPGAARGSSPPPPAAGAPPAARCDAPEDEALRELRALVDPAGPPAAAATPGAREAVERVARALARYRKVVEISDGYQEEFRRRLERAVRADGLTGFATRAVAVEAIEEAFERARAGGPQPALLVVEVRGMRALNHRHGVGVGDRALVALSRALRKSAAVARIRARWSGAAFAVVVDARGAEPLAARVVGALRAVMVTHGDAALSLGVEAGLARAEDAADAGAWIRAAEDAVGTVAPPAAPSP